MSDWQRFFSKLKRSMGLPPPQDSAIPLGYRAEWAAELHLKTLGFRVIKRNLQLLTGEIDLLMLAPDGGAVVIVEVKAAAAADPPPEVRVNITKQKKLTALAKELLRMRGMTGRAIRFDVVAVIWPPDEKKPTRITHYPSAFEATS